MKCLYALVLTPLLLAPAPAFAAWAVTAKVTYVEASFMPDSILFQLDQASGSCSAGSYLTWNIRGADVTARSQNAQAVFALLMTAKATGQSVRIVGNDPDATNGYCNGDYVALAQ